MSEILDVYAAEAEARKYRDMAATEVLAGFGYKWETYQWVAPDGLTPRQLAEQRAELLEMLDQLCTCPQSVDQATIPAAGVDAAPDQVIVALSVSLTQLREARTAIANATQQRNATGGESSCSDERPCIPCFTGKGACDDVTGGEG